MSSTKPSPKRKGPPPEARAKASSPEARRKAVETMKRRRAEKELAQGEVRLEDIPDVPYKTATLKRLKKYAKRKDPVLDTIKVLLTTALMLIERG